MSSAYENAMNDLQANNATQQYPVTQSWQERAEAAEARAAELLRRLEDAQARHNGKDSMIGLPFTITWDSQGFYRVSIPNYEGGEVVTVEDANAAIAQAVAAEREAQSNRYEALINLINNDRRISTDAIESYVSLIREMYSAAIRARNGAGRK